MANETKVAVMQEQIKNIERVITKYETNHFPTIDRRFDAIEERFDEILKEIGEVKIAFAKYIGIGIGGIAVLEILLKFVLK